MLIRIKYLDNRFDMVRPEMLDRLLEAGKVREFARSSGWVMPGIGNLRRKSGEIYTGPDRRKPWGDERRSQH